MLTKVTMMIRITTTIIFAFAVSKKNKMVVNAMPFLEVLIMTIMKFVEHN